MINELNVTGMHCKACKALIESELSDMDGVKAISVDLAGAKAQVEYDEQKIQLQSLIDKIVELGYQATTK